MPSQFAYWDIRGIGQSIRYLLDFVGEDYNDIRYVVGEDGDDLTEMAHADVLLDEIMDVRNGFVGLCYGPDFSETAQQKYKHKVRKQIAAFEKYLGDKQYFLGDKVTVPDFHIYEMMAQHRRFDQNLFDATPNLKAYLHRFEEIPAIKKHISTEKFKNLPLNNQYAMYK